MPTTLIRVITPRIIVSIDITAPIRVYLPYSPDNHDVLLSALRAFKSGHAVMCEYVRDERCWLISRWDIDNVITELILSRGSVTVEWDNGETVTYDRSNYFPMASSDAA